MVSVRRLRQTMVRPLAARNRTFTRKSQGADTEGVHGPIVGCSSRALAKQSVVGGVHSGLGNSWVVAAGY
jgi:hypothetical protein